MIGCLVLPRLEVEAETRRRPELRSAPLVVQTRGRVEALSGLAEQAGLRVGLRVGEAQAICPQVVVLPRDEGLYRGAQEQVLSLGAQFVLSLEPSALGELFFLLPSPHGADRLSAMAAAVTERLALTGHVGAGSSKLVAKLAARGRAASVIAEGEEPGFLAPLSIDQLWPLEAKVRARLLQLGLTTIGLLQQVPEAALAPHFGLQAHLLAELSRGRDHAPLRPSYPPQIAFARAALPEPVEDATVVEALLRALSSQLAAQLGARHQTCRHLSLRLETEAGRSTRQVTMSRASADAAELLLAAHRLLTKVTPTGAIAALSLRASGLERQAPVQLPLLTERDEPHAARAGLLRAIELVRREFGEQAARWAREREVPRREQMLASWWHRP